MTVEGGFNGRTNKLVDGCYSFWQGGVFPLIYMALKEEGKGLLLCACDGTPFAVVVCLAKLDLLHSAI